MTDRRQLARTEGDRSNALTAKIAAAAAAGVDLVQIREKDLDGAQLAELAQQAIARAGTECRILINDRLDVAQAVGAAGVHLGEKSVSVREARSVVGERGGKEGFLIGASIHSLEGAQVSEEQGADYVIFGPVFATPSKASFGPPQGLERLEEVCRRISIPVLAIGGITVVTAQDCFARGAAGIAGIRLFQETESFKSLVRQLRQRQ